MVAAVIRYLRQAAGRSGTLLVLDDLQWAGTDALDLLLALAHAATEEPVRVLGAYRDTDVRPVDPLAGLLADLAGAELARQRKLGPMASEDAGQMLDVLLHGVHHADGEVRAQVLARAGGVPFFLVSCAQELRQSEQRGAPEPVPWDVAHSVRQRVAALPEGARDMLGVVAVTGRVAPCSLLISVAARPARAVVAVLEAACQAGVLAEEGPTSYRFTHDLIREVVEADLGAARRMLLHRDIAQVLERMPGEPPVETLAYHYRQTEEHAKAAHWLEQAGDQAAAGCANTTARDHYTAAHEHLPHTRDAAASLARLDEKLGDLCLLMGEYAAAREHFMAARAQDLDRTHGADLWRKEGIAWERQGEYAHALAALAAAEMVGGEGDSAPELSARLRAAVELSRAEVHWAQSHYGAVEAAVDRAVALLSEESPSRARDRALAHADHLYGHVAYERGDLVHAEVCYRRSLDMQERIGDEPGSAVSWLRLGRVAHVRGDLVRAAGCYRRSLAVHERLGDQHAIARCCTYLGRLAHDQGHLIARVWMAAPRGFVAIT
jgi:tetratricopeptide (TPR) repeat protein